MKELFELTGCRGFAPATSLRALALIDAAEKRRQLDLALLEREVLAQARQGFNALVAAALCGSTK
jgi:hypothetical protein